MKNTKTIKKLDDVLIEFRQTMTTLLLKEATLSGFSLPHFEVLMYIAHSGEVTMKDIASWLHITPPSASVLVDNLVKKNLLTRAQSDKDRRTVHIILSREAHKLIHSLHKHKMSVFKKMLARLSNEDKENLVNILNKCVS